MNEQQLRDLVREAVARHLDARHVPPAPPAAQTLPISHSLLPIQDHPSHSLYVALVNRGDECVIEPSVTCNHCGYCKSQGY